MGNEFLCVLLARLWRVNVFVVKNYYVVKLVAL
jgi:hypothetical protein